MSFLKSNKVLYHPDRFKQWMNTGDTQAPVNVKIDLTNVCNHNCPGCTGFGMIPISEVYGDRLDFKAIYKTLGEMKEAGVKGVNYTGGGEPTLYKDFEKIIDRTHELGLEIGLITNGGAFQRFDMEKMLHKFLWIRVSLDSYDQESHSMTHGSKAKFDLTIDNMKNLAKIKKQKNLDVTLGAAFLTNQYHALDRKCHKFVELVKKCGFDYAQIRPSFGHFFDYDSIKHEEWSKIFKELNLYKDENFDVYFNELKYEKIFSGNTGRNYEKCHAQSFKSTAITATGDVYVCCSLSGEKNGYIGSIYKQTFAEIWNGEIRKNMLKNLDVRKCPQLCIGDELNEFLNLIKVEEPKHKNFL